MNKSHDITIDQEAESLKDEIKQSPKRLQESESMMNQMKQSPEILQKSESMKNQMKQSPNLLQESAGGESCCIFRVPQSLFEINKEAYQPRIVSIGPYHYGDKNLEMIQEHKWRFLNDTITRTEKPISDFLNLIVPMEKKIRESYSESTDRFDINDLAEMMVLDGFFLIELFRKVSNPGEDPIFKIGWISPFLMRDILRIENQIPFFVLQKLFESLPTADTLQKLIFNFFNHVVERHQEVLHVFENIVDAEHLLDFFRLTFTVSKKTNTDVQNDNLFRNFFKVSKKKKNEKTNPDVQNDKTNKLCHYLIPPVTKLVNVGVKFKVSEEAHSFLDIEFQDGLLLIPHINMDDFYSSFFMNCMVFEQCYCNVPKHITAYVVFMGCLMDTSLDVSVLSDKKIIDNYLGTDKELAKFFKDTGKDVVFDIKTHYLADLFMEVNNYSTNGWHVLWAGFIHTYFESPWASISAFAAFILLSLTVIQTLYSAYSYHKID